MPLQVGASLNVNADVLGISGGIASAINETDDRSAFVKDLMETTFHQAGRKYNVMVFNLEQEYQSSFKGVKFYASAKFDGGIFVGTTTFGICAFEEGTFVNEGDGGYINWAFRGRFDRNDKHVAFRKF